MGLLDRAKDMLGDHKDQVVSGIEQAEDLIESKTPDSVDSKVETASNKIQDMIKKLD